MFKSVICLGTLVAIGAFVLVGASTSERYIGNAVHEDYPGMCYYRETKTPIAVGETFKPTTECTQVHCREDFVLRINYCPRYMLGEGCTISIDKGAKHPDCCPKIECPKRN